MNPEKLVCDSLHNKKYKILCSKLDKKKFDKKFHGSVAEYMYPELQEYFGKKKVPINKEGFTLIKDVDMLLLEKLNDEDLANACLVNKYVYSLCQDEFFWRTRFLKRFENYFKNIDTIPLIDKNEFSNTSDFLNDSKGSSWKEYYIWMSDLLLDENLYIVSANALKNNRIDVWILLDRMKNIRVIPVQLPGDANDVYLTFIKADEKYAPISQDLKNLIGPFTRMLDNNKTQEGYFIDGMKEGIVDIFDQKGNIIESGNYEHNEKNGWFIIYNQDGGIKNKYLYRNGQIVDKL